MTKQQLEALMEWALCMVRLEIERGGAEEMAETRARYDLYRTFGFSEYFDSERETSR